MAQGDSYRLTSDGQGGGPVWTPDSRSILYVPPSGTSVLRRAADGSGPPQVVWQTSAPGLYGVDSVTPDGSTLLMARYGLPTRGDILGLPLHGDPIPRALLETPASEDEPQISPDGRWLAYHWEEPPLGYPQLYVQAYPDPGGRWSVTQGAGQMGGASPRWSRDGHELYFIQNDMSLWAVPVKLQPEFVAGRPEKIAAVEDILPRNYADSRYDVLPGEREFVLIVTDKPSGPPARLEVVLGWAAALRARSDAGGRTP